ncbi:MAG: ribbon-helix-helix protein, CopG family [Armatimonadota bacterium]
MSPRRLLRKRHKNESPVSIRVDESVLEAVRAQAQRTGRPVSRVIRDLLEMALRMQRFPGIIFIEGPAGRRAYLAGTGLDVWEVIELLREYGSTSTLREHFPRLSPMAIQIVEAYAKAYPAEIGAFLALNTRTSEELQRELPWLETVHP